MMRLLAIALVLGSAALSVHDAKRLSGLASQITAERMQFEDENRKLKSFYDAPIPSDAMAPTHYRVPPTGRRVTIRDRYFTFSWQESPPPHGAPQHASMLWFEPLTAMPETISVTSRWWVPYSEWCYVALHDGHTDMHPPFSEGESVLPDYRTLPDRDLLKGIMKASDDFTLLNFLTVLVGGLGLTIWALSCLPVAATNRAPGSIYFVAGVFIVCCLLIETARSKLEELLADEDRRNAIVWANEAMGNSFMDAELFRPGYHPPVIPVTIVNTSSEDVELTFAYLTRTIPARSFVTAFHCCPN